jgi:hypothetical protein
MRILVAGLSVLLLVPGCGAAPAAPGTTSPTASAAGTLGVQDDQRTLNLHVGESIEVALAAQPGFSDWSHPVSNDPAVMAPQVDPAAAAIRGMTLASFKAVGRGHSDIRSAAGAACSPGAACPAIARGWQVHVVVS